MDNNKQTNKWLVIAINNLSSNGMSISNGKQYPYYQLGNQEITNGYYCSEYFDEWEIVDEDEEGIVVCTPGLCNNNIPDDYEFEHEWILLKSLDENVFPEYLEVCVVDTQDEENLKKYYQWYDDGAPDD